jgi:anti-sigma factor (TIGR02949 family)
MNERDERDPHADIGCLEAIEALYAYIDGELEDDEAVAGFERHMNHCQSCFSRAEIEGLLTERMRETGKTRAPEELQARLRHLMEEL